MTSREINARKADFDTVLDPFEIEAGWFWVEFSALQLMPNPDLEEPLWQRVQDTIDTLRLNHPEVVTLRQMHYDDFLEHGNFEVFRRWCPHMASEYERQRLRSERS